MSEHPDSRIDLYWRPGCGFCTSLRRQLDRLGITRSEHNIWEEPDRAAVVRSHARGNETVPTVVVDGVALVNPSPLEVVSHLAEHAPSLLPPEFDHPTPDTVGSAPGSATH
jgi:glutaredoxin